MNLQAPDIRWFHSFALPGATRIDGIKPINILQAEAQLIFPYDLAGKSVLDIGAWDGFFSFEAERRGADRVVATDHFCWSGGGWGTREGFDYIHQTLESRVEAVDVDIPDLDKAVLGQFDQVLLLGVLYHVKDPYSCLEKVTDMCADHLVIETVTSMASEPLPSMRLFKPAELNDDPTNFWAPNVPAIEVMLGNMGFAVSDVATSPISLPKATANGALPFLKRLQPSSEATSRTIVHARRL